MERELLNWESTGLLHGLEDDKKIPMADLLQRVANKLLSEEDSGEILDTLETLAFPIARRVMKETNFEKTIDANHFVDFFVELMGSDEYKKIFDGLGDRSYYTIDVEAEACVYCCEKYVEYLTGE